MIIDSMANCSARNIDGSCPSIVVEGTFKIDVQLKSYCNQ